METMNLSQRMLMPLIAGVSLVGLGIAGCQPQTGVGESSSEPISQASPEATLDPTNQTEAVDRDVPYVPTPQPVVDEMLRLANVSDGDVVYDLGSGDGRIVISAAQNYDIRGVGVDIDPALVQEARENANQAGVGDRVEFIQQDLFETDISDASVVTLYLLPDVNLSLRPKLLEDLQPGTRIVSHAFDMGDWKPEKVVEVGGRTIYFWTVPEEIPAGLS